MRITKEQARQFLVSYHGLHGDFQYSGKAGVLDFIARVGSIQYDPLNIVGRNPDLVLQSRIKNYKSKILNELLYQDRLLVDEWDKEMSIYPIIDWPFFERNRKASLERYENIQAVMDYLPHIREMIEEKGPISSLDLELDQMVDWAWAPTRLSRAALESMYLWGELIVYDKVNTRKVYDFAEKHIPKQILEMTDPNQTMEQYHDWHVLRRIGAVGMLWNKAGDAWLGIKGMKSAERTAAIERLLERKFIIEINVEDIKCPLYIRAEQASLLEEILLGQPAKPRGAILAPLDNLIWDRKLIKEIFDFEYRWEVYKPVSQRKYGYYVLPILYGNKFIARFEPVLDKKSGKLVIKNWWWEDSVKQTPRMLKDLQRCLEGFAVFTGSQDIAIDESAIGVGQLDWLLK